MSEFLTKFSRLKGAAQGTAKMDPKFADDPKAAADFANNQLRGMNAFDLIEKVAEQSAGDEDLLLAIKRDVEDIKNEMRQLRQSFGKR